MNLPDKGTAMEQFDIQLLPSIFETPPADTGGINARIGFAFQDDVAAGFYLEMLSGSNLVEVSCETYDDILLVWQEEDNTVLEFVQVKAENPDHLWTIAKLCEGPDHKSILEKSLSRDKFKESSCFRIVTSRQIHSELDVLTRDRRHEHRSESYSPFKNLIDKVEKRLPGVISKKKNGSSYWLKNTYWDVYPEDAIEKLNAGASLIQIYSGFIYTGPSLVKRICKNHKTL